MLSKIIKQFFLIILTTFIFFQYTKSFDGPREKRLFSKLLLVYDDNDFLNRVKNFLNEKGEINVRDKLLRNMNLLMFAAQNGLEKSTKFLLEKGIDINAQDAHGFTALMNTAIYGQPNIAKLLLEKGADIDTKNNVGKNAYNLAIERGPKEMAGLIKNYSDYKKYLDKWKEQSIENIVKERKTPIDVARKIMQYAKPPTFEQFLTDIQPKMK